MTDLIPPPQAQPNPDRPSPPQQPPWQPQHQNTTATSSVIGGVLAILGGLGIIIGAVTPWLAAYDTTYGWQYLNGMTGGGDGNIMFPIGLVVLVLGAIRCGRDHAAIRVVTAILVFIVWLMAQSDLAAVQQRIYANAFTFMEHGPGLGFAILATWIAGISVFIGPYSPH